jgi:hypothetical protein
MRQDLTLSFEQKSRVFPIVPKLVFSSNIFTDFKSQDFPGRKDSFRCDIWIDYRNSAVGSFDK